jgi:hypothetical protein
MPRLVWGAALGGATRGHAGPGEAGDEWMCANPVARALAQAVRQPFGQRLYARLADIVGGVDRGVGDPVTSPHGFQTRERTYRFRVGISFPFGVTDHCSYRARTTGIYHMA